MPTTPITPTQLMIRRFKKHKLAVFSLYMLIGLYAVAVTAEFWAPQNPLQRELNYSYAPPQKLYWNKGLAVEGIKQEINPVTLQKFYVNDASRNAKLTFFAKSEPYTIMGIIRMQHKFLAVEKQENELLVFYPLGADQYGRCLMSRILVGARVSLSVGLIGVFITFILGITIGGISGYAGGKIDLIIQRFIEIINAFPTLPLWLALGASVPPEWSPLQTYFAITVALSLLSWTGLARVVRGKILALREEEYALAAKLIGASRRRILIKHLLPGFTSHILVSLTISIPGMILGETSLSFLGLGLRPPIISWGVMLQDCMDVKAVLHEPWLMAPVIAIILTVLAFNFLGDGLRDAADPFAAKS